MHDSNLTDEELKAAHKNELEHIFEIKERWLRAYDRGEHYKVRDEYEDTFGFTHGDEIDAWQRDVQERLKAKPDHIRSIVYLLCVDEPSRADIVIRTKTLYTERLYLISRITIDVRVRIRHSSDEFLLELKIHDVKHTFRFNSSSKTAQIQTENFPPQKVHCELEEYGLFELIFQGIYDLGIDKKIQPQLLLIYQDYVDEMKISQRAFQKTSTKMEDN
jgi:hypothetical protein